jgi:3-isopropylmalate/(R)-2-methylmalate dehydratase small subunit
MYKVYNLGDNISTDDILPGAYIKINPATSEGFTQLGEVAFSGLPPNSEPFLNLSYDCVTAGENFGCGSSREHAVVALQACGVKVVIAKSFARIFFRNCIATGAVLPIPCPLIDDLQLQNGDNLEIDLQNNTIASKNKKIAIEPIGELSNIVQAGGMFAYARKVGKINNIIIPLKNY